ncbi:MAG: M20/M25/M40 family metallo-hydrolase [Oscillospiraceae bacterium]|nr:M20/M25/M40 family metallo-hydrolase [Oscillospiraceae bacterium]
MKKRLLSLVCAAILLLGCSIPAMAAESRSDRVLELDGYDMIEVPDIVSYDSEIVMTYIQEFANFTQVPRPSHYTTKMTEYLTVWAEARGIEYETEEIGNVIMYIPATEGLEDAPTVIFQGHIDMVAATDEGVEHDWQNDPLDLIWSENSLTADGTSLGADNGSGVAFMLTYMDYADEYEHGPLRFIFTVDEEDGLLGAAALDAKYLEGADYMINVDGGYGGAVIACAGGKYFTYSHEAEWTDVPEGYTAYTLEFAGLQGGHSAGVGNGKANGLVAMADALVSLHQAGIDFNLVSLEGGSATNAIPSSSKATIVREDTDAATEVLDNFAKLFKESYEATETEYTFTYGASDETVEMALDADLSVIFVQLMSSVPNNIHTLLATAEGTESSSNLGLVSVTEDELSFTCFMRSSSTFQAEQITLISYNLAELSGFDLDIPVTIATWPLKANNLLSEIAAEVYYELTGEEYTLSAIHAGVECGEFAEKDEDLYIISTGISGGSDGHTTAEAMNFDLVDVGFEFLATLATTLANEG